MLVEVNCETDFAARSDDFQELVRGPGHARGGRRAAIPGAARRSPRRLLAEEREIAREQALKSGKPEKVVDKIVEGKLEKFYAEHVLLEQAYVKDPDKTVGQLITEAVGRIGENIQLRRFARFVLGDEALESTAQSRRISDGNDRCRRDRRYRPC